MREARLNSDVQQNSAADRRVERLGVLAVVAALGAQLAFHHDLKAWSDPASWYAFGRNFFGAFGERKLAYGFPLLVAVATRLVGPYYAFLVNIPVLMGLLAVFYVFVRRVCRDEHEPFFGPLCAAAALLTFVAVNTEMLRTLANPYRDPWSFLLLLASTILLLRFRDQQGSPRWAVFLAGLLLALSCSTRETNILMLAPMFFYALVEKLRYRELPFAPPMLVFAAGFLLGSAPYLVQNALISGHALVPAQATRFAAEERTITPGIEARNLLVGTEATFDHLVRHYGRAVNACALLGLVIAIGQRQKRILALVLPALLTFAGFYACYDKIVPRYLWVVDFFAVPLAAFGAAWIGSRLVRRLVPVPRQVWARRTCAAALFAAAATVAFRPPRDIGSPMRLHHARAFAADFSHLLPPDSLVLCERPLHGIFRSFTPLKAQLIDSLGRYNKLWAPGLLDVLRQKAADHRDLYFACHSRAYERFMQAEFDLVPIGMFDSAPYGLTDIVDGPAFSIYKVVAWSQTSSAVRVHVSHEGEQILTVDVGRLSKIPRAYARLWLDGTLLDAAPLDGFNYYLLPAGLQGQDVLVRLESDAPVPAAFQAQLAPWDGVIEMTFKNRKMIPFRDRFSPSFFDHTPERYPDTRAAGYFKLPTVAPTGADYFVSVSCGLDTPKPEDACETKIRVGNATLYTGLLRKAMEQRTGWQRIAFALDSALATNANTRVDLEFSCAGKERRALLINRIAVLRLAPVDTIRLDIGSPLDEFLLVGGVHDCESGRGEKPLRWRWTDGQAQARLPLAPGGSRALVRVRYLEDPRPQGAPAADLRFFINGVETAPDDVRRIPGDEPLREARFTVSMEPARKFVDLEILSSTWCPRELGLSQDARRLGVRLHALEAERI